MHLQAPDLCVCVGHVRVCVCVRHVRVCERETCVCVWDKCVCETEGSCQAGHPRCVLCAPCLLTSRSTSLSSLHQHK